LRRTLLLNDLLSGVIIRKKRERERGISVVIYREYLYFEKKRTQEKYFLNRALKNLSLSLVPTLFFINTTHQSVHVAEEDMCNLSHASLRLRAGFSTTRFVT